MFADSALLQPPDEQSKGSKRERDGDVLKDHAGVSAAPPLGLNLRRVGAGC